MNAERQSATMPNSVARTGAASALAGIDRALPLAHTALASVLEGLAALREPLLYHPVPGNAGDSAINAATYQLFDRFGLAFEVVGDDVEAATTRGRVVVCSGGGNLVPFYSDMRHFVARHHAGCRQLVLLPATMRGHEDLLGALGQHVTLLCRDRPSFEHVRKHAPNARVEASHDVALHLNVEALRTKARQQFLPLVSSPAQARRNLRRRWRALRYDQRNVSNPGELFAFRTDVEGLPGRALNEANLDVSVEFVSDDMSPALTLEATWRMLAFLDRYPTVHTDRLHVAILSALLGKEVRMHDNSYGKNRVVYEQSLRDAFPRVTPMWAEAKA